MAIETSVSETSLRESRKMQDDFCIEDKEDKGCMISHKDGDKEDARRSFVPSKCPPAPDEQVPHTLSDNSEANSPSNNVPLDVLRMQQRRRRRDPPTKTPALTSQTHVSF